MYSFPSGCEEVFQKIYKKNLLNKSPILPCTMNMFHGICFQCFEMMLKHLKQQPTNTNNSTADKRLASNFMAFGDVVL